MAATMATTMAVLNTKCLTLNTNKTTSTSPKPTSKPISLSPLGLSNSKLPMGLSPIITAPAIAGAVFATLGSVDPAFAVQQLADIAAEAGTSDNRGLALLLPIIPALGWVLFNILQPALNQINKMRNEKKAFIVGLGLSGLATSGLLLATPEAQAASEEIARGSDNRGTLLLLVVLPAIGWVLFNILQPALNQLNKMRSQ
ncbi:hypothetical protein SOVF_202020 [Spinacia oleracea]|uniref:Photosystem II reaction center proteins PsbY, chloroplastic n=2 Tax=Spinacia oleracea TaxID=3562 RepID=PSBY_SPIOL|nr:photosystem II reaction center proteins PsbY, chloroplastic [Spinacia oleracea]P80470.2 RecName: Full=Photosystem II reaction center proteins PsbY, chloroplastic; AltName: Full=L-arginine-metabolizing enzyme; Short=L-AME; Contains: RecName: Full=Photosystem II reaction center protein PsbY-1, chloroplastic; AltName: Full=PsbY-A1; Contains: RecName: Full=Photosystem II reaction center protein PsbY-2, chloroplastic; AltName: Full=PsbY-A2; Flags: Precursor [Spinacia oleracea]AAC95000.1 PsbY precur